MIPGRVLGDLDFCIGVVHVSAGLSRILPRFPSRSFEISWDSLDSF